MNRLPELALAVALVVAGTIIVATIGLLPPIVPSHFGFDGRPDRWSPRDAYVAIMLALALGLPLLIVASTATLRGIPTRWINLPHRDYWLAPERREHTYHTLRAFACSVGALVALFIAGLHVVVITGALTRGGASPNAPFLALLGLFVAGIAIMLIWLARRFARPGG